MAGRGTATRRRKPAKAGVAVERASPTVDDDRIIDAALTLAARDGWRATSLPAIAAAAGVGLIALYDRFPDKPAIVAGVMRRVDRAMLASDDPPEGSPRDRLFDVVMRRFDALQPLRHGIAAIVASGTDPLGLAAALPTWLRSLAWMLEAAGIGSSGVGGRLRVAGLAVVYGRVFRVWLDDDSADLAKTMAALDRGLAQAERWAGALPGGRS